MTASPATTLTGSRTLFGVVVTGVGTGVGGAAGEEAGGVVGTVAGGATGAEAGAEAGGVVGTEAGGVVGTVAGGVTTKPVPVTPTLVPGGPWEILSVRTGSPAADSMATSGWLNPTAV